MLRYAWILLIAISMGACTTTEEVVEETHPNGKPKKVTVYADPNGDRIKVQETLYYENGQQEQDGKLNENTLREGKWTYWYEDGKVWSEYHYQNGARHGVCKVYFPNGQARYEGQWEKDEPTGRWKFWNAKGDLIREKDYSPVASSTQP